MFKVGLLFRMTWTYILFICIAVGAINAQEFFDRVKRAPGKACPKITNFDGRVKYRRRGTRAVFRCKKTFTRYGNKAVNCLSDNTWSGEPPVCIKAGCVPIDIQHLEKLDMTEMYGGALLSFTCEDDYQLLGTTEIYCDAKVWSSTPPVCKAPTQLTECDFEDDLCGWSQDDSDDLDWTRNQGQTSTGGTGPKTDHTLHSISGHYMFVESSNPAKNGDQARLLSPVYPADMGDLCFEFWYHILGPADIGHVGTLAVYVRGESQFIDDLQPVFVKEGDQGDVWKRGEIYIDQREEPYQIVIVTVRKLSYISDIAIDDVKLYNCSGPTTTSSTTSTTSTTASTSSTSSFAVLAANASTTTSKPESTALFSTVSSIVNQSTPSGSEGSPASRSIAFQTTEAIPSTTVKEIPYVSTSSSKTSKIGTSDIIGLSQSIKSGSPTSAMSKVSSSEPAILSSSLSFLSTTPRSTTITNAIKTTESVRTSSTKISSSVTNLSSSTERQHSTISQSTVTSKLGTTASFSISSSTPSQPAKISTTTLSTLPVTKPSVAVTSTRMSTPKPTTPPLFSTTRTTKNATTPKIQTSETTSIRITSSAMPSTKRSSATPSRTSPVTSMAYSKSSSIAFTKERSTPQKVTTTASKTSSATSLSTKRKVTQKISTIQKRSPSKVQTTSANAVTTESLDFKTTRPPTRLIKSTRFTKKATAGETVSTKRTFTTTAESNNTNIDISVAKARAKHPADETLKPLMIGLGVGIFCGLIIIGVIAYVCVRRRKFYVSRYEDELKPITKSSSNENFNNVQYEYHDDEEYEQ